MKPYIRKQVAEVTGVNPTTIQQYTDKGLIIPSYHSPEGRGTTRLYSEEDMVQLLICRKMVSLGVKHLDIARIFAILGERCKGDSHDYSIFDMDAPSSGRHLVICGEPGDKDYPDVRLLSTGWINVKEENGKTVVSLDMTGKSGAIVISVEPLIETVKTNLQNV